MLRLVVGEQHRAALDGLFLERVLRLRAAERLPDEVRDQAEHEDHQRDERDSERPLEVRAFHHVVVEERREVLRLRHFRVPAQAEHPVRDVREHRTEHHEVQEDENGSGAHAVARARAIE